MVTTTSTQVECDLSRCIQEDPRQAAAIVWSQYSDFLQKNVDFLIRSQPMMSSDDADDIMGKTAEDIILAFTKGKFEYKGERALQKWLLGVLRNNFVDQQRLRRRWNLRHVSIDEEVRYHDGRPMELHETLVAKKVSKNPQHLQELILKVASQRLSPKELILLECIIEDRSPPGDWSKVNTKTIRCRMRQKLALVLHELGIYSRQSLWKNPG